MQLNNHEMSIREACRCTKAEWARNGMCMQMDSCITPSTYQQWLIWTTTQYMYAIEDATYEKETMLVKCGSGTCETYAA